MSNHPLARIEARIAGLVEGAFTQVFGGPSGLQAAVASLSIALDEAIREARTADGKAALPGRLVVRMRSDDIEALHAAWPGVEDSLARRVAEHSTQPGQQPPRPPQILFAPDDTLVPGLVVITADQPVPRDPTGVLPRIDNPPARFPADALLVTDAGDTIPLTQPMITLGRAPECSIVLHDPYASRVHAQIRLKGSRFYVLDAGSQAGTFVNETSVREQVLRSGDVLRLGHTRLIYQDQQLDELQATQPYHRPTD